MVTLHAIPFTCSFAVHLELVRLGLPHRLEWARRGPGRRVAGGPLVEANPKRKVPTLVQDGAVWTEVVSVLHHLDRAHGPVRTDTERRVQLERLCFVATDLHQAVLGPAFDPEEASPGAVRRLLEPALAEVERMVGRELSEPVAAYLSWALMLVAHRWPEVVLAPAVRTWQAEQAARPHYRAVVAVEAAARRASA